MSKYRYGKSGSAGTGKLEKSKMAFKVGFLTLLILIPAVIYIVVTTLPPNPVTGKSIDKGRFDPSVTFTTESFTFTVPNKWEEALDLHKPGQMYVYRERNGGEVIGLIHVYIDYVPPYYTDYYTRALPVVITDGTTLSPKALEPHCGTTFSAGQRKIPTVITQNNTQFKCWPDGTNLYIVASEIGGDSTLQLRRQNGKISNYIITYTNTAFTPNEESFITAMKTFKSL